MGSKSKFTESQLKNLCLELAQIDTEEEVIKLLSNHGLWDNQEYWRTYGDKENNFRDIGNQQARSFDAIVEKFTNSIDAKLMREVLADGIDPENPSEAPGNMHEAVEMYFDVPNGNLRDMDSSERNELAKSIAFVASGEKKSNPTYTVIDDGEGQHPDNFPNTLLSLDESNKLRIPFVQGEFNMGGTGTLPNCGEYGTQLIISRRAPELRNGSSPWGFTVIRKFDAADIGDNIKHPIYKYLVIDGDVPRFGADSLKLRPSEEQHPEQCSEEMNCGTFIKLYDYNVPSTTNIVLDPYYRMSARLPKPPLPIRFYETRDYSGHSLTNTLDGLDVRLDSDRGENVEPGFPTTGEFSIEDSKFTVRIYAIKHQDSTSRNVKRYRKAEDGIIFTINGQSHSSFHERFFSRKGVNLDYIRDSLIVLVDCSNMTADHKSEFFMNSRDRIRRGDIKDKIEDRLKQHLGDHDALHELVEKRKEEALENQLDEDSSLADAFETIVSSSSALSGLFSAGSITGGGRGGGRPSSTDPPDYLKKFPTWFEPKKDTVTVPCNSETVNLKFDTDAENDYFDRTDMPGTVSLINGKAEISEENVRIWNGTATISLDVEDMNCEIQEGSSEKFVVAIEDEQPRPEIPFINEVVVEFGPEREEPEKDNPLDGLPSVELVDESDWEKKKDFVFTEDTAMYVVWRDEDTGYHFMVNVANKYLVDYVKNKSDTDAKLLKYKFAYSLVILGASVLDELAEKSDVEGNRVQTPDDEPPIEELIHDQAKTQARVIMPMIDSIEELNEL